MGQPILIYLLIAAIVFAAIFLISIFTKATDKNRNMLNFLTTLSCYLFIMDIIAMCILWGIND